MNNFQKRFSQLKQQPFRWFLMSTLFGSIGGGSSYICLTWIVTSNAHALLNTAILMLGFWLPSIVIGPFAGSIVDHFPHRKLIASLVLFTRAVLYISFALFYFLRHETPPPIMAYLTAVVSGICLSFYSPTLMRYVREIIPIEDMIYANSTLDIAYEIGNMIGMSLSALVIALTSPIATVGITGVLFAIAGLSFLRMKPHAIKRTTEPFQGVLQNWIASIHYLKDRPMLLKVVWLQFWVTIIAMTTPILLAPFARHVLHASVEAFGNIEALLSLGVILGGLILPSLSIRFGFKRVAIAQLLLLMLNFIVFSLNRYIPISMVIYFLNGFGFAIWPLISTEIQTQSKIELQGRLSATQSALSAMGILICYLLVGFISEKVNLAHVYWVEVAMCGLSLLLLRNYTRKPEVTG
ncbi:MAG: MFS transporter [Gammaproteobacteria bacterium]|nr:MFS transporter [Gammaproteobacteria bacterium]